MKPFRTEEMSRTHRAILALEAGPMATKALAQIMGLDPRKVHSYLMWARASRAIDAQPGLQGRTKQMGRKETIWTRGPAPVVVRLSSKPVSVVEIVAPQPVAHTRWRDVFDYAGDCE